MWNYIKKIFTLSFILSFFINPFIAIGATNTLGNFDGSDTAVFSISASSVVVYDFTTGSVGGTVTSGRMRTSISSAGSMGSTMVIYSNSGGNPNTLLATSDEVLTTNTAPVTTKTYTFTGQNRINLEPNTTYFIGIHFADDTPSFRHGIKSSSGVNDYYWENSGDTYPGAETTFTTDLTGNFQDGNIELTYESPEGISYPIINSNLNKSGLRLDFDGVDERLTSASNPSYSSDTKSGGRTLCMWFNLDSLPASETNRNLFSWSNSDAQGIWNFRIRTNRGSVPWTGTRWELQTALDTGAGTGTSTFIYSSAQTFTTGTDYNLCLVSSGTAWTLYVNGSSTTLTVTATGSGGNDGDWWGDVNGSGTITFTVGGTAGGANIIDGKIDDISYYDDDLTATEVSSLYNGGKPIHPMAVGLTDLSGYWKLGEAENGSITTIYDMRGTDNWSSINMENADIVTTSYY